AGGVRRPRVGGGWGEGGGARHPRQPGRRNPKNPPQPPAEPAPPVTITEKSLGRLDDIPRVLLQSPLPPAVGRFRQKFVHENLGSRGRKKPQPIRRWVPSPRSCSNRDSSALNPSTISAKPISARPFIRSTCRRGSPACLPVFARGMPGFP